MKLWMVETLLVVTTVLGGAWVLFHLGELNERRVTLARQAIAERAAHTQFEAEVQRGQAAASRYIAADRAKQAQLETLTEQFDELRKRVPLVIARPRAVAARAAGAGAVVTDAVVAASALGPVDLVGPGLTAGAVWMWNSALAGADMPAGACGAAGTATEPCAADTGLGLEAAWQNHATNARTCASDRRRQQELIDFLTHR